MAGELTVRKPETSQETAAQDSEAQERKRRRKPGRDVNEIFRLFDDDETAPEFLIALPVHVDVRRFVKRNYGEGDYLIKNRIGGKFKSERELHIEAEPEESAFDEGASEEESHAAELYEPLREGGDLLTRAEAERIAARAAREAVEGVQRTTNGQPSALDIAREIVSTSDRAVEQERKRMEDTQRMIASMMPQTSPTQQPDATAMLDTFERMLGRVMKLSDRVNPIREAERESRGVIGDVLDFARETLSNPQAAALIAPALSKLAGGAPSQQQGAPAQFASQPAQTQQQATLQTLSIIAEDLKRGRRVGRAADVVEELLTKFPALEAEVNGFLQQPAPDLLAALSAVAQEDLSTYSNALGFIESLQDELTPEDDTETEEAQPTLNVQEVPSRNGQGAKVEMNAS